MHKIITMEKYSKCLMLFLFNICLLQEMVMGSNDDQRKLYIVYMGELPEVKTALMDDHHKLLMEAIGDEKIARQARVHSYGRSFNGFAARLLPHEADSLSQNENVVSVFPNTKLKLLTTRSWDFLGMPMTVERNEEVESNIIVGLLDSGIYLLSESFSDAGYGPPPEKWKGQCQKGDNFTGCNNKVIGAQYFDVDGKSSSGKASPADFIGHGTHTSSIAAGVPVYHASLDGLAEGTARGGVPLARVAMYKVCWSQFCNFADILAGFDAAIADGVDVISVSLGGLASDYFHDPIAIGSFHAVKKGIFVSAAGGNEGPQFSSIENGAPWIMTVAASAIDRVLDTRLELGNGQKFHGNAINLYYMEQMQPLVKGTNGSECELGNVDEKKVKGKIVFCKEDFLDELIKDAGGIGIIKTSDGFTDTPSHTCLPSTTVTTDIADQIDTYINSTWFPRAMINKSRELRTRRAPWIASFSSRGPEYISRKILKPDLAAPGDAILAAFSELTTLAIATGYVNDTRIVPYNMLSGTSMSAPHAASAIAYIKSFHPNWSPAALRSALMTTAKPMRKKTEGAELATGSGNIDPVAALDPGLVYDMNPDSYITFLCQQGYNDTKIVLMTGDKTSKCSDFPNQMGYDGLNYPSIHYQLWKENDTTISAFFLRTVTHVGKGESAYKVKVKAPEGLSIEVVPETLYFNETGQQASFKATLEGQFLKEEQWYMSGSIVWSDSEHIVKTPVLVYRPQPFF